MLKEVSKLNVVDNLEGVARELRTYLLGIYGNSSLMRTTNMDIGDDVAASVKYDAMLNDFIDPWMRTLRFPSADSFLMLPFILSSVLICHVKYWLTLHDMDTSEWTIVTGIDTSDKNAGKHVVFLTNGCMIISIKIAFSDTVKPPILQAYCGNYQDIDDAMRRDIIALYVRYQILYEGGRTGKFLRGTRTMYADYVTILHAISDIRCRLPEIYDGYDIVFARVEIETSTSNPVLLGVHYPLMSIKRTCVITIRLNPIGFDVEVDDDPENIIGIMKEPKDAASTIDSIEMD